MTPDMERRKIRELIFRLPSEDVLTTSAPPPRPGEPIRGGTVGGGTWKRAQVENSAIFASLFVNADLTTTTFESITLDSCRLVGCDFTGAHVNGAILKGAIFDGCRFDKAAFTNVRAVGPVAFLNCNLDSARFDHCRLGNAIFDQCSLIKTAFTRSDLHGCDMRNNDLSQLVGITNARGLVVTAGQLPALTLAMAAELDFTIKEPPAADGP